MRLARWLVLSLLAAPAIGAERGELSVFAVVDVGRAPHQIAFDRAGTTAYIAAPGSGWIAVVDVDSLEVTKHVPAASYPMGVVPLPSGDLLVSRFRSFRVARLDPNDGRVIQTLSTGAGPSLFTTMPGDRWLVTAAKANRLWVVDGKAFSLVGPYETGRRPFHASATSDGKLAFVPAHEDGSVTVVDLEHGVVRSTVHVGDKPTGGVVLPGDKEYALTLAGENRLVFIDTATDRVVHSIEDGIGEAPFYVDVTPSGSLLFTANTRSHDISVVDLDEKRVVQRLSVGAVPVVVAVHPSGDTLWVASEGSHTVSVIRLP